MTDLDSAHLDSIVESILFISDAPLSVEKTSALLRSCGHDDLLTADVISAFERLRGKYSDGCGLRIDEVAGGLMLRTNADNAPYILKYLNARPEKLSRSALETLAIVAYRQPVTKTEVDEIRGIDSGALLRRLLEKDLIKVRGRKNVIGRPFLYGTTQYFLEVFGLNTLDGLPDVQGLAPNKEFRRDDNQGVLPLELPTDSVGGLSGSIVDEVVKFEPGPAEAGDGLPETDAGDAPSFTSSPEEL